MMTRHPLSPARAALHHAVKRPIGGMEDACADSTAELFISYALTASLSRVSGTERLRTLAALRLAIDVLTVELGAAGADARLDALAPSPWMQGILAVLGDLRYSTELQQHHVKGIAIGVAIQRDAELLAARPGRRG